MPNKTTKNILVDDKDFIFSLRKNDLIKFSAKKPKTFKKINENPESKLPSTIEMNDCFVYYQCANINGGKISVIDTENIYEIQSLGIQTLVKLEKYKIDVLGNYKKVEHETRKYFK